MSRLPRRRLLLVLAAAVAALAGALAAVMLLGREAEVPEIPTRERPAAAFLDSIGVVTHFPYTTTAYGRRADVLARLHELGVRHIRDAAPTGPSPLADGLREAAALGIDGTLGTNVSVPPEQWVPAALAAMPGKVAAFEAPNEIDKDHAPGWPAQLQTYMTRLAAEVHKRAPGGEVIGPSFIYPGSRAQIPRTLPGAFNAHPYSGGLLPEPTLGLALDDWHSYAPHRPAVFTETGFHDALRATSGQPPTSPEAAAVYIPRVLLTAFGAGVQRTFIYELVDVRPDPTLADAVQHWGLLHNDFSPKPAFLALRNLIAVVRSSPGAGRSGRLDWDLKSDQRIERVVLVRADGSRVIALWRAVSVWNRDDRKPEDPGLARAELTFHGRPARDVSVWRPSLSSKPALRRARARKLDLELGGDVVLVSLR
jgi:hypothetical protein